MAAVVVVGSINVDLHLLLNRHILPGETLLARGGTYSPGGKGANQACASALAGADTALLGAVGDDGMGPTALARLVEAGVDLSHVVTVPGPTGLAVVSVDAAGENTVVVVPGANGVVAPSLVADWAQLIEAAPVVVLQGEISAESNQAAAAHAKGRLMLNLAPVIEVSRELLRQADPLVVNEHEGAAALSQLTLDANAQGEAAPPGQPTDPEQIVVALRAAGVPSVVMTIGSAGSIVSEGDELTRISAPKVTAVDTVGAGDAFTGALAARLAAGDSITDGAAYASRFAAYTVQFEGAQASYPRVGAELPR